MAQVSRLVAFGDSCTYGHGLADCYLPNGREGPIPSVQAWPFLLARKLQLVPENQGQAGASNKEIWYKAVNFDFKKGDIAVFLWSYLNRHCMILPEYIDRYGPWLKSERSNKWMQYQFNDYDSNLDLWLRIDQITKYLSSKKIKCWHYLGDPYSDVSKWHHTELKYFPAKYLDFARDGKHPGFKTQQKFADIVTSDPTGPAVAIGNSSK